MKKLFGIMMAIVVLLTGCTKTLQGEDKKPVINEVTGQNLTENILCRPTDEEMRTFMKGVYIDGRKTCPAKIRIVKETKKNSIVEIIIHEGRNRQVKKMCEEIGHKVITLQRYSIGSINIDGLKEGKWRYLTDKEISKLK